jgi:uncharacterized membrane protein
MSVAGSAPPDALRAEEHPLGPPANRMGVAVCALAGALIAGYMSLYTVGIIPTLACGTGGCETVQHSPWAVFLGVPVPFWGVAGYALLFTAALMGIQPARVADRRIAFVLLAASTWAFLFSIYLSWIEATRILAWCRWCIGSAVVATLLFVLSLPEIGRLRGGRR